MTNKNLEMCVGNQNPDNFFYDPVSKKIGFYNLPQSIEEAKLYADCWRSIIENFSDKISELTFYYEEHPKILPLNKFEKFKNYFGANIMPKEIKGEFKEYTTKPILVNNHKSSVQLITDKKEFDKLSDLSKNTIDLSTTYVFALEPLCYRSFIRPELIKEATLKEGFKC